MYSHPSAPLLLQLTQLTEDRETLEALETEGTSRDDVMRLVIDLEAICDCTFRDYDEPELNETRLAGGSDS